MGEEPVAIRELQRIPTSGARAVERIQVDGLDLLAIPQLAIDIPGQEPSMHGGDSDTELLLLERRDGGYMPRATLPAPGGEDAESFAIGDRRFLAVASIRSGAGPYSYTTGSVIHEWDDGRFVPFQTVTSFAAKQWKHWRIDDRDFLGLAQGVQPPGKEVDNRSSVVFEWDGTGFTELQEIPSRWAYNWHHLSVDGADFVAHADHLDASVLYRWDGERLVAHQELMGRTGRAFASFESDGGHYLLVAGLEEPVRLMRWEHGRFETLQSLEGLGGRELTVVELLGRRFVIRVNFIHGTPRDPQPSLTSVIYEWDAGALHQVAEFPTTGGTDVEVLGADGPELHFAISNSLAADVRFASETVVYGFTPNGNGS